MAIINIKENSTGPVGLFTDVLYYYVTKTGNIVIAFKQEHKEDISFACDGMESIEIISR